MNTATTTRAISWFEIPTHDLDRATRFYETLLDKRLKRENFGGSLLAIFEHDDGQTGGALVQDPLGSKPAAAGPVLYLDAGESAQAALERARRAGGIVEGAVIELPREIGYIAYVLDTEGNRIGLHARGR
ncbi:MULTISPECIES: VOC family protein [unclassified Burkholderia]|uniref:VOC family protein n=1 Tax=unclassified Burkholderia TaxID=2613784 RepID=UPI00046AF18B|nr:MULTISPECIES: VOC family protein [unclassified Burkholderia]NIF70082.1 VOC family protein [Burkholderia sp. Ap-962]